MRKYPSIGFIYLFFIFVFSLAFFVWAFTPNWYDRMYTPSQKESDVEQWASYLENIVNGFSRPEKKVSLLEKAVDLRFRLNQPNFALLDLEKTLKLVPEKPSIKAKIAKANLMLGEKDKAWKIARDLFDNGFYEWDTISILLAGLMEHGDEGIQIQDRLLRVLNEIKIPNKITMKYGTITLLGFSPDFWTTNGDPGYLIIENNLDHPFAQKLWLACYADQGEVFPLKVSIMDGIHTIYYTFDRAKRIKVDLPEIPQQEKRIFVINTDKTWVPQKGADKRRLGVRVMLAN